ncbi:MAG: hypothetical protein KME35_23210 [Aphanocapsa sp. GSE-SYN-MK-11-07L]|jgi:hypothetical protein|nr:hypothetical protein [Aphanocapsa sp. GSE-SYN-MK-11-07L]
MRQQNLLSRRATLKSIAFGTTEYITSSLGVCAANSPTVSQSPSPIASPTTSPSESGGIKIGTLEVVAELPIRPTVVVLNSEGRTFITVYWFDRQEPQLVEVTGRTTYRPFPDRKWNCGFGLGQPEVIKQGYLA